MSEQSNKVSNRTKKIDAVIFDCDSTLSTIEGIDYLAEINNVSQQVVALTEEAMSQKGINERIYSQRLQIIKPTEQQVFELGQIYFDHLVHGVIELLSILKRLNKMVYIISAGLLPAVVGFAKCLNINANQVYAVNLSFDSEGCYKDFDRQSPLISNKGKAKIVNQLKQRHDHIAYIGDGMNDLCCKDLVDQFIGFGGVKCRENIKSQCDVYLEQPSIMEALPYLSTELI